MGDTAFDVDLDLWDLVGEHARKAFADDFSAQGARRVAATLMRETADAAVRRIGEVWRQGLLATVVAVGDYLIKTFYEGDLDRAKQHAPARPGALARLLERADELPVGVHQLRQAIRVSVQYREL